MIGGNITDSWYFGFPYIYNEKKSNVENYKMRCSDVTMSAMASEMFAEPLVQVRIKENN